MSKSKKVSFAKFLDKAIANQASVEVDLTKYFGSKAPSGSVYITTRNRGYRLETRRSARGKLQVFAVKGVLTTAPNDRPTPDMTFEYTA